MSKYSKKTSLSGSRAVNKQNPPVIKPLIPKPKSKQASAASFFQPRTPAPNPCERIVEGREEKAVEGREEKTVEGREEKTENKSNEIKVTAQESTENRRPKTGFQMWLEENRANILTDNPDLNEAEVIKEGMSRFRMLTSEERMVWTEKAKGVNDLAEEKKRKRPTAEEDEVRKSQEQKSEDTNVSKRTKPSEQSTNARLSAFAFKQS
ncbi:WDHD1 protein, partial [Sapayoa aenigma]|nr:WDHD1 protein [Sapayoa aenigma]